MIFSQSPNLLFDNDLGQGELERRVIGLVMLVSFRKHQTIPSFAVPAFLEEKFLKLYFMNNEPGLDGIPFVRLTTKGRKVAELSYKICKRENMWDGGEPVDMYLNHRDNEPTLYLMNHRRYLSELAAGKGARLIDCYHNEFEFGDF